MKKLTEWLQSVYLANGWQAVTVVLVVLVLLVVVLVNYAGVSIDKLTDWLSLW